MAEDIESRVMRVVKDTLGVTEAQITREASFVRDLGADSLDQVQLVMNFEEEFKSVVNGNIPESDATKLTTVGSVIDYISGIKQKKQE